MQDKIAIIFNAAPQSGKDYAASLLNNWFGWHHMEFKDALFYETCKEFGCTMEWFKDQYNTPDKDVPKVELRGLSKRQALIYTSEEKIKPTKGKDYFGVQSANSMELGVNVFSDGGFEEEFEPIYQMTNGKMIICHIDNENCTWANDSRKLISSYKDCEIIKFTNNSTAQQHDTTFNTQLYYFFRGLQINAF